MLTARPYVLDSGETLRWILEIDGEQVPDADVRTQEADRAGWMVMLLVYGDEEVEIARWSTKRYPYGPPEIQQRLGELPRG